MSKQLVAIMFVLVLTIGPTILHGRYTNRWRTPPDLEAAADHVRQMPASIGGWLQQQELRQLSAPVCQELGLVGHIHRRYVHATTGEHLDLLLMVGPPGKLVRHPPELCYTNRANQRVASPETLEVSKHSVNNSFKMLRFRPKSVPGASSFVVAYAFADHAGIWSAPNSPRMTFGAEPVLYKLQVLSDHDPAEGQANIEDFLSNWVDVFRETVADAGSKVTL